MKHSQALSLELWLELDMAYSSDAKPLKIIMEPNKRFSYCVPRGNYKVSNIFLKDRSNNIGVGEEYPELTIKLEDGHANYIGHIFVALQKDEVPDSLYVPNRFTISYAGMSSGSSDGGAGFLFGGAGGAISAAASAGKISGEKQVLVGIDKNYKPACKSPLKQSIIIVKKKKKY